MLKKNEVSALVVSQIERGGGGLIWCGRVSIDLMLKEES